MTQHSYYFLLICIGLLYFTPIQAEDTFERIYTSIFATQCTSCHGNSGAVLPNLEADGMASVRNNIRNVTPNNSHAADKGHKIVYAGHQYRSYLFRLFNDGLAGDVSLDEAEIIEAHANVSLSNVDKELIRQWIMFGAPLNGEVTDHDMIEEFYAGNGVWSIDPSSPPPPPAEGEGFQIHIGPIFVPAWNSGGDQPDIEYNGRYDTNLTEDTEIYRMHGIIGSSHHIILNKFSDASDVPYGLSADIDFGNKEMVVAYGGTQDVYLPEGTAFKWEQDAVIDLNPHIVNYSTAILANDAYINVYTQAAGTAVQEMKTDLIVYPLIFIPGDGELHTFEANTNFFGGPNGTIHIWNIASHTHKLGQAYKIWLRNTNGSKGPHIYDATKYNGIPECENIAYDYQHPPRRVFSPFLEIDMDDGFIHEASYLNCAGCGNVGWGNTVNDEMMLFGISYVESIEGVSMPQESLCFADEITGIETHSAPSVVPNTLMAKATPNPFFQQTNLQITSPVNTNCQIAIFDVQGKQLKVHGKVAIQAGIFNEITLNLSELQKGIYLCQIVDDMGNTTTQKLMVK